MNHRLMDPGEFRERLNDAFGAEPPHELPAADVARGRRRLRRRRAAAAAGAFAAVAVVAAGAAAVPAAVSGTRGVGPAAGGGAAKTDREIVATCMHKENVLHRTGRRTVSEERALSLLGEPTVMSRAMTPGRAEATLLSEDGLFWGECQFATAPEVGVKNAMGVFRTDVGLPKRHLGGGTSSESVGESEPGLEASMVPATPQLEVTCVSAEGGRERYAVDARCPEFRMYWNDRRPAEVAAVRVVTPDGVSTWADVEQGYLSFAYTGDMTPRMQRRIAHGDYPGARRVVFYDREGNVLVDDRHPGRAAEKGAPTIQSFPSLAWWTR